MDSERIWYPYENGTTIGRRGPAGGRVLHDEELGDPEDFEDADARITLEAVPEGEFALTANVYGGWLQETATYSDEALAVASFTSAKTDLERLAELIPDEEDRDLAAQVERLNTEVTAFVGRLGGRPTL